MSDRADLLGEHDVRQLVVLLESLNRSSFDYLQLQVGELKVTLSKGEPPSASPAGAGAAAPAPPSAAPPAPPSPAAAPAPAVAPAPALVPQAPAPAGAADITAPILGVFYAQSQPGAEPFVRVGSEVQEDTTVALVEVMKTFNAIPAGVRGTVVEVCVGNAQLVEFGQVLFRVRPAAA